MSNPVVLLIHGVNSTGEWHNATTRECHGVFECVSIKYRYYHGLSGALKIYAWPTALLLLLAASALLLFDDTAVRLTVILVLLFVDTILVVWAEFEWSGDNALFILPLLYLLLGLTTALILEGSARLAFSLAALAGTSVYLDLREYGYPNVSATKACVGSILLALGVAAWGVLRLPEQPDAPALLAVVAVLAALAVLEPYVRRRRAFQNVRRRIEQVRQQHPFPHVVAHSLGTYLTGHLLNEEPRLFLGRVIFTGCVLDRGFLWHKNVGPGTLAKCWAVKNYVGGLDLVPVLTGLLRSVWVALTWLARVPGVVKGTAFLGNYVRWRPLGWAGQWGFHEHPGVVHSQTGDTICSACVNNGVVAAVHNVAAPFASHSTLNQDSGYQRFQWLPFLWGDTPDNFHYWQVICLVGEQAAVALERLDPQVATPELLENQQKLAGAEQQLLKGPWHWPRNPDFPHQNAPGAGRQLRAYIEEMPQALIIGRGLTVDTILHRLPVIIFKRFAQALAEKDQPAPRPEVTALVEPRKVVLAAVCDAINMGP